MQLEKGCMAIVEPRKHLAFDFVVHNFHNRLLNWPIHVFHGSQNEEFVRDKCKDITQVIFHPLHKNNLSLRDYNRLLTSTDFYANFAESAEYVMIFQTDCLLFPHCPFDIEYFLGYDYIGALWSWYLTSDRNGKGRGGNGGLSLRKVQTMIDMTLAHQYPLEENVPEDLYFSNLPLNFAPEIISRRFSVESLYYPCPFGAHKPWHYMSALDYIKFQKYAPALKLLFDLQ